VIETPEKRTFTPAAWEGQGQQAPGVNWHSFELKRVLGTIPVEEDGSAYFQAPSGKFLYFQILDKDKKMVQSMRSGVSIHPGESSGCIGCHEDRLSTPVSQNRMPLALRNKPHTLGDHVQTAFSYVEEVQPLFDRHCISCHDFNQPAGEFLVLAGDRNPYFNASYVDLHVKNMVACVGGGPSDIQEAYSWGSHRSRLTEVLEKGHHDVSLSTAEMEILYTWIDLNGIYYPSYESAYPDHPAGRSPLTSEELYKLEHLCGVDFGGLGTHQRKLGPQISFDRPELSPCLKHVKGKKDFQEALRIITKGSERLAETPRADMKGFIPCEEHQAQLEKYQKRRQVEALNARAIQDGSKRFDSRD
jgi:hypothetical protein